MILHSTKTGIDWFLVDCGEKKNPPLLLLHGFAGTHRYWSPFLELLSQTFYCLTPDLPGHGKSVLPEKCNLTWDQVVDDLSNQLRDLVDQPIELVGYSLGARFAMHLLAHSHLPIQSAILISGSAGISDLDDRLERDQSDEQLAKWIENRGMEWFSEYWENLPIFKHRQSLPIDQLSTLRDSWMAQNPKQLAKSLRTLSVGKQEYLLDHLSKLDTPMLFIAGKDDLKYANAIKNYVQYIPNSRLELIPNCGHDAPTEQPDALMQIMFTFLTNTQIGSK